MFRTAEDHILLLWSLDQNPFPDALEELLRQTSFSIHPVHSLHDAAAQFTLLGPNRVRALLIDPLLFSSRNTPSIDLFLRHIPLPLLTLPGTLPASTVLQRQKILPWSETIQWIAQFHPHSDNSLTPDNSPPLNHEENAVTSTSHGRYDELDTQPILSPQEMRALLGAIEE